MNQLTNFKIILASKSPRRKELLKQAGFDFEIIISDVEEKLTKKQPEAVVRELAYRKGYAVFEEQLKNENRQNDKSMLVIGADTVVVADGMILGKPKDHSEAYRMIDRLQGKVHQVYTGVSVFYYNHETNECTKKVFAEKTDVRLYPMSQEEILRYIATGDCYDKAGGYGIQGGFAIHVQGICGDYNNVVGLPIARLYQELSDMKSGFSQLLL